jgi:hypothetical protein
VGRTGRLDVVVRPSARGRAAARGEAEPLRGALVSGNYFRCSASGPRRGRTLTEADDAPADAARWP